MKTLSHDSLGERILIAIAPFYVQRHVNYLTDVLRDLHKADKVSDEEKKVLEHKVTELSVRQQAKGCVMMARQMALEWELSGGELEKALSEARTKDAERENHKPLRFGEPEGLEINLGNRPRL
jgi:hypothetical protein